jgi:DNA-binding Xre family transcriptional regulator
LEIKRCAKLERDILLSLKRGVSKAINDYIKTKKIGFNELVRRLGSSPAHVTKIKKGDANLTLASLAHIFALLEQKPQLIIDKKDKV